MAIVTLPLLDASEPAIKGNRLARENRFSGVISTDGTDFRLHLFRELLQAVQQDPSRPLSQVTGHKITLLHTSDAAAAGLDLAEPNPSIIEGFLRNRGLEAVVAGLAENLRTGSRTASLLMLQNSAETYASYQTKSFKCSVGKETIDEDNLPADGKCKIHKDGVFEEQ
jgi:hypothetical protein